MGSPQGGMVRSLHGPRNYIVLHYIMICYIMSYVQHTCNCNCSTSCCIVLVVSNASGKFESFREDCEDWRFGLP